MPRRVAVKRLEAVEVDPKRSNQHEFHAGTLRRALDLDDDKVSGHLRLEVHSMDGFVSQDSAPYTLYDARLDTPGRSEWRLYYTSRELQRLAAAGDLLVLYRPDVESNDLSGLVVAAGSTSESRLLRLLELGEDFDVTKFRSIEPPAPDPDEATLLAVSLWADDPDVQTATHPEHPLLVRALELDQAPNASEMAKAAADLTSVAVSDPDRYLVAVLDAETALYYSIETRLQERRLKSLLREGGSVPDVLNWAMSVHQARRSRRGQSLQLHFGTLLGARKIRHTPQCKTEAGETPDFVFPGCTEYHDPSFPADRLRVVACKSTSKERWRQVLNEAKRVPIKYLLTLDTALTAPTISQMVTAGVRPHIPRAVIDEAYAANPEGTNLGTVADLLNLLEAATI